MKDVADMFGNELTYKKRGFAQPRSIPAQTDAPTALEKAAADAMQVVIFVDGVQVATARTIKDSRKAAEKYRREVKPRGIVTAMCVRHG